LLLRKLTLNPISPVENPCCNHVLFGVVPALVKAMRRREFIKVIAGSAVAWPLGAEAQTQSAGPRRSIGVLMGLAETDPFTIKAETDPFTIKYVPAIYPFGSHAKEGGLVAYGVELNDLFRQAATYVDRILKGEKPADLPVQAPTKYELIVNLKTAKSLDLTVPASLLARADEVIE
jgi:hypothetical protein